MHKIHIERKQSTICRKKTNMQCLHIGKMCLYCGWKTEMLKISNNITSVEIGIVAFGRGINMLAAS